VKIGAGERVDAQRQTGWLDGAEVSVFIF
jgi:hypothetical protein